MKFERLFESLKAQKPARQMIEDQSEMRSTYRYWRIRMLYGTFIGYAVFYFVRKNLSAATPALIHDLGCTKTQLGTIWSILYLSYGVSKLVNGVIGDQSNPRYFMAIGLFLSAIANIFFGMSSSLVALGIAWGLNGWFQGMGWPACVRSLSHWFATDERGVKWGLWNTSHQVGAGVILVLCGYLTQVYGWRSSFYVPAAIAVVCSLFLANRLRDTPESLGLPSVEKYRGLPEQPAQIASGQHPVKDVLFKQVLRNRQLWFLSIANFFVYIVRYGALDWAPTFLVEVKKNTIVAASAKGAMFEALGIGGALLAGWLSDGLFRKHRSWVNVLYMAALAFAVLEFWLIPPGHPSLDALALSAVGFLVYGPQMLVGVCAADISGKQAAGTGTGLTGFLGYLGSIFSGVGVGWIVDHYGWSGGFAFLVVSAVSGAICFLATGDRPKTAQIRGLTAPKEIVTASLAGEGLS
jgi:glycerol-3-phosphate transporter